MLLTVTTGVLCKNVFSSRPSSDVGSKGQQDVANAKALNMSLRYSFVTPLTSLVVTKPEAEAGTNKTLLANKLTESKGNVFSDINLSHMFLNKLFIANLCNFF